MDINKILNSDYIDIIFDGRNKLYGSYELRKQYPVRARRAAGIVLAIMFLLVAIPLVIRLISGVVENLEAPKTSKRELVMKEPPPLDPKKPIEKIFIFLLCFNTSIIFLEFPEVDIAINKSFLEAKASKFREKIY